MRKFPAVIRTEYTLALLFEKNREKAENIEKSFERYTKKYPYETDKETERSFMRAALDKFEGRSYEIR